MTAGVHTVRVTSPYLWEFGAAETQVTVPAGQNIPVEYRSPLMVFFVPGSIGPPPQKYNGLGLMLGIMVAPLVLILLLCCFSFIFI